jgi:DNA-binding transcriptional MerR regulator
MRHNPLRYGQIHILKREGVPLAECAELLIQCASDLCGIPDYHLTSKSTKSRVCYVRWAIWVIMKSRGYGDDEIAMEFNRDRSSVTHGMIRVRVTLSDCEDFKNLVEVIRQEFQKRLDEKKFDEKQSEN